MTSKRETIMGLADWVSGYRRRANEAGIDGDTARLSQAAVRLDAIEYELNQLVSDIAAVLTRPGSEAAPPSTVARTNE